MNLIRVPEGIGRPRVVVSCIGRGFDLEDADHITGANGCFAGPWNLDRDIRKARELIGLADGFRFHDLRHFYASLLIASGADVKVVQYRLRHASAKTTLDTYSHLWPDSDESTRTAVEQVLSQRLVESSLNRQASR